MVIYVYVAFKRIFGAWLYFSSRYFCSFCSAVAYETRTVSMVYRLECPGRSVLEGCVLLIISSMPFLACSFFYFVANTTYFPEVEDRYVGSMCVTEGKFTRFSFNPEYMVSSPML